jgi:hypothetical protein
LAGARRSHSQRVNLATATVSGGYAALRRPAQNLEFGTIDAGRAWRLAPVNNGRFEITE